MHYDREIASAIEAVTNCSKACIAIQRTMSGHATKDDLSPVTVADYVSQAVASRTLKLAFPSDPIVGEEDSTLLRDSAHSPMLDAVTRGVAHATGEATADQVLELIERCQGEPRAERFWVLDPVDGTKGFLRGGQFAVALALLVDGEVAVGVLGCPALPTSQGGPSDEHGCIFFAVAGGGSRWLPLAGGAPRSISVNAVAEPSALRFCESVEAAHSSHDGAARVAAALGLTAPPLRMDSQAKYAAVARGDAGAYLRLPTKAGYEEKIWDHAAGALLVTEAGGRVTDCHGRALAFGLGRTLRDNTGVIATNGLVHDRVLRAVSDVVP